MKVIPRTAIPRTAILNLTIAVSKILDLTIAVSKILDLTIAVSTILKLAISRTAILDLTIAVSSMEAIVRKAILTPAIAEMKAVVPTLRFCFHRHLSVPQLSWWSI
jgi:hypothetical protein